MGAVLRLLSLSSTGTRSPADGEDRMLSRLLGAIALGAFILAPAHAGAQERPYPNRPITLVVPFATGGSVDAVARVLKPHLEQSLGQPIVLDYRPGGATTVGTAFVARARPDGYTLGVVVDAHTTNPSLYRNLPFDTVTDLAPVTMIGTIPLVVAVNAASPHDTLPKLIAAARAGRVSYASVGVGSINHLAAELLSRSAGVQMTHVPYRGGGPAVTDLLGRHVDMMIMSVTLARPQLSPTGLSAVAVTSEQRVPALPDVPTAAEAGVANFTAFAWQGVVAPAATPPAIVQRLNQEWRAALARADVREALGNLGVQIRASSPEEFAAFIRTDIATWARVVREANIQPE
jgi:tripartite-type tricarboxylate transporter receptor subunit TctC